MESTAQLVDKLVEWDKLLKDGKKQMDEIKSKLQSQAIDELKDKKQKQISILGSSGSRVIVTQTDKVELVYAQVLRTYFGKVIADVIKEEVTYKVAEPFKRLLAAAFKGEYIEQSLDAVVKGLTSDEKLQKLLLKKLKGNFDKDVNVLKTVLEYEQKEAENTAYLVAEAITYERILMLSIAAGYAPEEFGEAVQMLKNAVMVDESIKLGLEYEVEEGGLYGC